MAFECLLNRPETRGQLVIRWADILILNSDHIGSVDKRGFRLDWTSSANPPQEEKREWLTHPSRIFREEVISKMENKDPTSLANALSEYRDDVKTFLLKEGYINPVETTEQAWLLTERGKLVKELKGHYRYTKHRKREVNILKHQNFINWCLIIATGLSAIMPIVASRLFQPEKDAGNSQNVAIDTVWLQKLIDHELRQRNLISDTMIQTKAQDHKPMR